MFPYLNIAAHKFVPLADLKGRRARLLALCKEWNVKGSILLSPEGIDLFVAGEAHPVETLLTELRSWPGLHDLELKISGTEQLPFRRMHVRVKGEITRSMRRTDSCPSPDPALQPTEWAQCFKCRTPLSAADQSHRHFEIGKSCPYCFETPTEHMAITIARRHEHLNRIIAPLPGSHARDHVRPINVPAECDGMRLLDALCRVVKHIPAEAWAERCARGFMLDASGRPADAGTIVRAGERYLHKFPDVIEPDVDMRIEVLHEDESIVVLNKPAPLPMHAGGRFHRNTLKFVLDALYHPQKLRPAHRLDANTTGVLVVARTQFVAGKIQPQFARGEVTKLYLVRVQGHPAADEFSCDAPISATAGQVGSRVVDEAGLPSRTEFKVVRRFADGTALLEARPLTGRTNQIRVHLWHLGFPVCGDPSYLAGGVLGQTQTLDVNAPPLCLHAWQLRFKHPLHKMMTTFTAPAPEWLHSR